MGAVATARSDEKVGEKLKIRYTLRNDHYDGKRTIWKMAARRAHNHLLPSLVRMCRETIVGNCKEAPKDGAFEQTQIVQRCFTEMVCHLTVKAPDA
ncbi:hypothetical protein OKW41_000328 [Paraburkholderia sp. UCT70]